MSGQEIYDVSAKQKRIAEYHVARRTRLRAEYLQQVGNPYKMGMEYSGPVFDLGIQRFNSMRDLASEHFRPTPKNAFFSVCVTVVPIVLACYWIFGSRDAKEHMYRTGQVSYRDRKFQFTV